MKKLLATLLSGIIVAGGAAAFAACGDGQQGNGTTVTEEEWKTALSYFTVEMNGPIPVQSENPRTNFTCKEIIMFDYGEQHTSEIASYYDYKNMVNRLQFINDGEYSSDGYSWKDGNAFYDVGINWYTDRISYYKRKRNLSELSFNFVEGCDSVIYAYAGGAEIEATNIAQNYDKFTYSEESAEYTATLHYVEGNHYDTDAIVTAKFENGMLVYLSVNLGNETHTCTYTYGTTVTVPENLLNLPLGETSMPKN